MTFPSPTSLARPGSDLPRLAEIAEVLTLRSGFNTTVVTVSVTLLGLAAGVVGVFALLRKRALVTDALAHATLPGVGLAFLIATQAGAGDKQLPLLLLGATLAAVLAGLAIQILLRSTRLREDAVIAIVLSVGFGLGIVVLSYVQANAPAGAAGLKTFIYGQTAAMRVGDAIVIGAVALVSVCLAGLLMKEFAVVSFDAGFARVHGLPVGMLDMAMIALAVVVTVVGLQAAGLILVVALLVIPPVAARFWTDRLWLVVLLAGAFGAIGGYVGASVSALLPRKPAGAVIVLVAGCVFLVSMLLAPRRGLLSRALASVRRQVRIAGDHLLEELVRRRDEGDPSQRSPVPAAVVASLARRRGWPAWLSPLVLGSLRRRSLVTGSGRSLRPTEAGIERGARVARNHALWEQYLVTYADVANSHVDWSVDQVEHVLSDEIIRELEIALDRREGIA